MLCLIPEASGLAKVRKADLKKALRQQALFFILKSTYILHQTTSFFKCYYEKTCGFFIFILIFTNYYNII